MDDSTRDGLREAERARLLARLRAKRAAGDRIPRIERSVGRVDEAVSSVQQEEQWFLASLRPDHPGFNVLILHRLRGPLEPEILEQSLGVVVARHDALRTTFAVRDGRLRQRIRPELRIDLSTDDATSD